MSPQTRGIPDPADVGRIKAALKLQVEVQHQLETPVAGVLQDGSSVREMPRVLGVCEDRADVRARPWLAHRWAARWQGSRPRQARWMDSPD